MMILVIVVVRSGDYGRSANRETQIRRSIKQLKMLGKLFIRPNIKQKGNYLETSCDKMIRNVMCLKSQR